MKINNTFNAAINHLKQAFAIGFILIHLFYLSGYQLVFNQLENTANENMVSRLDDAEYSDDELIEFKIPVQLPYQVSNSDFERFDGEIEMDGLHYNYVKRKFLNDTLVVLCIPNAEKTEISTARETFLSIVNDINKVSEGKSTSPPAKLLKISVSDFNKVELAIIPALATGSNTFPKTVSDDQFYEVIIDGLAQPPENYI